jgi:hypothetical protein
VRKIEAVEIEARNKKKELEDSNSAKDDENENENENEKGNGNEDAGLESDESGGVKRTYEVQIRLYAPSVVLLGVSGSSESMYNVFTRPGKFSLS